MTASRSPTACSRRCKVQRVAQLLCNPPCRLRSVPEREARADPGSPDQLLKVYFRTVSSEARTLLCGPACELGECAIALRNRQNLGIHDAQNSQVLSQRKTTLGKKEAEVSEIQPCRCRETRGGNRRSPRHARPRKFVCPTNSWGEMAILSLAAYRCERCCPVPHPERPASLDGRLLHKESRSWRARAIPWRVWALRGRRVCLAAR